MTSIANMRIRLIKISSTLENVCQRIQVENPSTSRHSSRYYFTNTDQMKKDDPYAALGIQWGATTTEIKDAFKEKARALHPDVNKIDSPEEALKKFQNIQKAYSKLMDVKGAPHRDDLLEVSTRMQVIRPQGLEKITDIITSGMERNGPLLSGAIAI